MMVSKRRTLYGMDIDWPNTKALVMGLGLFGGGEAAARFLLKRGARVVVTDLRGEAALVDVIDRLGHSDRLTLRLGCHDSADAAWADVLVVNPAVKSPWNNPMLQAARSSNTRVLTEIRLALGTHPARHVIGITGSQGKSTTAAMVAHMLQRKHPELSPRLGGNIGGSMLDDPPPRDASLVVELSSFMLYWLATDATDASDRFTPGVAAMTNLAPNHLDWHETFEHYAASKNAIFNSTVTCAEPRRVEAPLNPPHITLSIPGEHNQTNAALAVAIVLEHLIVRGVLDEATPAITEAYGAALCDFPGLPHRLFRLGVFGGIECVDDSKATTPDATIRAVGAFPETQRIHLIAGGYDKGSDLRDIAHLAPRLAGLYTIGATGAALATDGGMMCETLANAVACARSRAKPNDVLLLSPGCASWDQFTNYEARGRAFAEAISQAY
jgi:UDP-N-acetylmuramoylalanine--D-glutamate ligase